MRVRFSPLVLTIGLLTSAQTAFAASDGFRCPDTRRIISVGDSTGMVVRKCREPDSRSVRTETRRERYYVQRQVGNIWRSEAMEREVSVEVEDWLYDFGNHDFMRELRFENGALLRVNEGGYGSK
jgi:Protein of unknown function (DUF2845)